MHENTYVNVFPAAALHIRELVHGHNMARSNYEQPGQLRFQIRHDVALHGL